jgi:hypothetical protein
VPWTFILGSHSATDSPNLSILNYSTKSGAVCASVKLTINEKHAPVRLAVLPRVTHCLHYLNLAAMVISWPRKGILLTQEINMKKRPTKKNMTRVVSFLVLNELAIAGSQMNLCIRRIALVTQAVVFHNMPRCITFSAKRL